ncbi:hypothetical protein V493_06972 [Pseudogymnoascus sp. VKM F-4281 (FW-2241)]|nr:hypothetical protein V493_06972 [Pseudogymnoascus sp. VKM F-4281 (FW-2241)]
MLFSVRLVLMSLLTTALAQFNISLAVAQLPACAASCSGQLLPAAGCAFEDIPNCLCSSVSLRAQVSACILRTCSQTEQYIAMTVSQNNLCKGVLQPSRSAEIFRVVIVLSAITFPIIVLRLFSRYIFWRIWWDDWAIIVSALLMVPMSVIPIYIATKGFGKHSWDVPPENVTSLKQLYYVSQILYAVVQNTTKISILLFFLRIFPESRLCLITKMFIGWMGCHTVAFFIAVTLQCVPPSSIWDTSVKGECNNSTAMVYAGATFSIIEDLVIIVLPVRELRNLNLSSKKKLAVMFMFALGSFACITSMVRLKYIVDYQIRSLDVTWSSIDVVIWSVLEIYTAMICACVVAIRPLLAKYLHAAFQRTLATNSKAGYSISGVHKMDFKPEVAQWSRNHGSAIELRNTKSTNVWADAESAHEDRNGHPGGLEVWVTRSVEIGYASKS